MKLKHRYSVTITPLYWVITPFVERYHPGWVFYIGPLVVSKYAK